LSLIAVGVAGATLDRAPQDLAWILLGFMGALFLAGVIVIVGQVYCRAIPAETRARTLVDASLACHAATIVSTVGLMFLPEEFGREYEWAIRLVNYLLTLAGLTCFTLFMRRVALVIHRPDLAKRATR